MAHTVRIQMLPFSAGSMCMSRGRIAPPTRLCGSCPWTWSLEIPTDPIWPEPLPTMLTQVLRFSRYGNYKSWNWSWFPCPLPSVLLPSLYVLPFTNTFPTNSWCFPPICPAGPSAHRTYCPLLSYPVALPLPLKIPNRPQTHYRCHIYFPDPIWLLLHQISIDPVWPGK